MILITYGNELSTQNFLSLHSSVQSAQEAIGRARQMDGYREFPNEFHLVEVQLDDFQLISPAGWPSWRDLRAAKVQWARNWLNAELDEVGLFAARDQFKINMAALRHIGRVPVSVSHVPAQQWESEVCLGVYESWSGLIFGIAEAWTLPRIWLFPLSLWFDSKEVDQDAFTAFDRHVATY